MLRQLIFAAPKPGMSEQAFQDYWVHKHAVQYASKIPEIRRYCVDTRIALPGEQSPALFSGVAEIWLDDVEALLAALQSPELIRGARADEPNWAAFWATVALNTETHELVPGLAGTEAGPGVKVIALMKRKGGLTVEAFRRHALEVHGPQVGALDGLRRYHQCHVPDAFYATAETPFDAAEMMWFDDTTAAAAAMALWSPTGPRAADLEAFVEPRYFHAMVVQENWIIPPASH